LKRSYASSPLLCDRIKIRGERTGEDPMPTKVHLFIVWGAAVLQKLLNTRLRLKGHFEKRMMKMEMALFGALEYWWLQ